MKTFSAAQEMDTIVFTFKAVSTAIKGGQVRFTLPRGWTAMKAPSADAVLDTVGELSIEAVVVLQIKKTADKPKTPLSVSNGGRTLTVGVPELAIGGVVTITINKKLSRQRPKLSAKLRCNLTQPKLTSLRRLPATSGHRALVVEDTMQGRWM